MNQPPPRPPSAVLDRNSLYPFVSQYGYSSLPFVPYGNFNMQDSYVLTCSSIIIFRYNRSGMFSTMNGTYNSSEGNFVRLAEG